MLAAATLASSVIVVILSCSGDAEKPASTQAPPGVTQTIPAPPPVTPSPATATSTPTPRPVAIPVTPRAPTPVAVAGFTPIGPEVIVPTDSEVVLAGMRFGPHSSDLPGLPKCNVTNMREGDATNLTGSALDFEATYLPAGVLLTRTSVQMCGGDVISVSRSYSTTPIGQLDIGRLEGIGRLERPSYYPLSAGTRLQEGMFAGKRVVLQGPGLRTCVFFQDEISFWVILSTGGPDTISAEERLKVAAGLRSK